MNNKLIDQLQNALPEGMKLPQELISLYQWIEENNLYIDTKNGNRIGFLFPEKELKENWNDHEREGGTTIEFGAGEPDNLKYWFGGKDNPEIRQRLCVFAQSGGEGSESALWLAENGDVKIVHMVLVRDLY